MNSLIDFPRLKCYCDRRYITNYEQRGYVECYVFAVTLLESRPLLFTIHTIDGAVYSRIPLEALRMKKRPSILLADKWGAISSYGQVVQHQYLKDYRCKWLINQEEGMYWATIDYIEGGFAHDPEQHKTSNIILMDRGDIVALPNNEVVFLDNHFVNKGSEERLRQYRRNTQYYTV